ncbi:MAG: cytochrome c-type biogenesis CcmF C-terminal domain-containing protein, partial [Panacagrimonas sp.]
SVETDVRLGPGQSAQIARYDFRFEGVTPLEGPNYRSDFGRVIVSQGGHQIATLSPEKRLYPSQGSVMTEAAVDANLLRDLYVALGEPIDASKPQGEWALRLYYKPMMRLVWLGGVFMFFGGILAASDRRYRLARKAPASAPQAAEIA